MGKYTVIWIGEVVAEDQVDAAKMVLDSFRETIPRSAIFDVALEDGEITRVDLIEEMKKRIRANQGEFNANNN